MSSKVALRVKAFSCLLKQTGKFISFKWVLASSKISGTIQGSFTKLWYLLYASLLLSRFRRHFFSLLSTCFAAAAELINGTQIAIKDCYGWQENCSRITACEQGANMTDATFKRCYATCCTTMHCNDMLHVLESTTLFINYSTPQAKSSSTHENRTTEKSTAPTSSSAVYKHISHLLVLLSVLPIAPYSIR